MSQTLQGEIADLVREGRKARERRKGWTKFWSTLIQLVISVAMRGLFLMIALDILHEAAPSVPALGYWSSLALVLLLRGAFLATKSAS